MAAYIYLKSIAKNNNNKTIIADLNIGLEQGTSLALIGRNNSGKSMLLKILAGIMNADFGTFFINGEKVSSDKINIRKKICYIPEYVDFIKEISIYENLYIYMSMYSSLNTIEIKKKIAHWANIFNFDKFIYSKVENVDLSNLRLIQLSRIFMHDSCDIIILDQPTIGLDPNNQILFWEKIKTVLKDKTIIYTSYDFDEIQNFSNRVAFLNNGNIKLAGTVSDIMNQTKGYGYYKIVFDSSVPDGFIEKVKETSDCYHLNIKGNYIEFYSPSKKTVIPLIKESFKYSVQDMVERPFNFKDVFLIQTKK